MASKNVYKPVSSQFSHVFAQLLIRVTFPLFVLTLKAFICKPFSVKPPSINVWYTVNCCSGKVEACY